MTASTPLGAPYPPCLHPMPRKEKLVWVAIWVVVAAAVLIINDQHHGPRQPLAQPSAPLFTF